MGRAGCVRCKDAGSLDSRAIEATEDAAACVHSAFQRPVLVQLGVPKRAFAPRTANDCAVGTCRRECLGVALVADSSRGEDLAGESSARSTDQIEVRAGRGSVARDRGAEDALYARVRAARERALGRDAGVREPT